MIALYRLVFFLALFFSQVFAQTNTCELVFANNAQIENLFQNTLVKYFEIIGVDHQNLQVDEKFLKDIKKLSLKKLDSQNLDKAIFDFYERIEIYKSKRIFEYDTSSQPAIEWSERQLLTYLIKDFVVFHKIKPEIGFKKFLATSSTVLNNSFLKFLIAPYNLPHKQDLQMPVWLYDKISATGINENFDLINKFYKDSKKPDTYRNFARKYKSVVLLLLTLSSVNSLVSTPEDLNQAKVQALEQTLSDMDQGLDALEAQIDQLNHQK